eukprot:scaffold90903_cov17-Tisochrysis_lutea.AAC.1
MSLTARGPTAGWHGSASMTVCCVNVSTMKAAVLQLHSCPAVRPAAAAATHHSSCVVSIHLL